jgi:hypothetical protein
MEWIEQNIDAYRIVAEILNELRGELRHGLESVHGRDWPRAGVPRATLERLIERKEREKSIDWYETEYQELTDYAGFEDLLELLEHNPQLLSEVRKLAPSTALLHARFLELEVMRSKLGLARPISENELSFLGTFHLRFRKALEAQRGTPPPPVAAAAEPRAVVEAAPTPAAKAAAATPVATVEIEEPPAAAEPEAAGVSHPGASPVTRPQVSSAPPAAQSQWPGAQPGGDAHPVASAEVAPPPVVPPPPERPAIDVALEGSDNRIIFRELYREVMEIAESLWTTDAPIQPRIWDKVRVSTWYEQNFSKRGLKPLSDFYEVVGQVWDRIRDNISRDELQEFLRRSNFAQLLLALRDMFQKNQL